MNPGEDNLSTRLRDLLAERFGLSPADIVPEARLYEDLDLDSIDAVDLALAVEELIGCKTSPQEFQDARTVAEIEAVIRRLIAAQ